MRSSRLAMFSALAVAGAAALAASPSIEPSEEGRPGSARNRPSGSKPVPGGGAKERARRAARMAEQSEE